MSDDINSDVQALAQKIVDEVKKLVEGVETLDANNWLDQADKIDSLNNQLQNLILPEQKSRKSTSSQKDTEKESERVK